MDPALADATIAHNDQSRVMETFLTNPCGDEMDIEVSWFLRSTSSLRL